ncbi:MAG: hypothetical protein IKU86_08355 [Thermoguttaceae bacterium]|nr:hypothetical protein [Thermoguttaceae bacterium]
MKRFLATLVLGLGFGVGLGDASADEPRANGDAPTTEKTSEAEDDAARLRRTVAETVVATVDEPEKLRRLDKSAPIWVSSDRERVVLGGVVCLREGPLEFFACRRGSKEHESVVSLDVPPHLIHAALLAVGAKQGKPAKFDPEFAPPTGEEIEIELRWRDAKTGTVRKIRAQETVREAETRRELSATWVFTGGLFGVDAQGKKYYLANVTGEVFGVSNFPGSVLDLPFESSSDNALLTFEANTEKIPPSGTELALILTRKNKPKNGAERKR